MRLRLTILKALDQPDILGGEILDCQHRLRCELPELLSAGHACHALKCAGLQSAMLLAFPIFASAAVGELARRFAWQSIGRLASNFALNQFIDLTMNFVGALFLLLLSRRATHAVKLDRFPVPSINVSR